MIPPDPREPRPARTGTLRHDTVPMRLYHDAKRLGAWDPRSLDLRRDVDDWARFTVVERDVLLRLTVLFQAAEESMTRDLLPLVMAVVREARLEEQLFLTTFLADEAKHTEFFRRVLDEVSRRMEELLPLTLGIVSEFFEPYDPMPFGLSLDDTVQDAIARFAARWGALEEAKLHGRALASAPGAEQVVRDILGWVGAELQPVPIEVRREGTGPVYTFHVGAGHAAGGALLITQEVIAHHTATDVIAALRAHRVPERLRAAGRQRLTCLSAGGKIIVQPPE
jgi:hypothetical protein